MTVLPPDLDDEERMLGEMLARIVADRVLPAASSFDAARRIDDEMLALLEQQGLMELAGVDSGLRMRLLATASLAQGSAALAAGLAARYDAEVAGGTLALGASVTLDGAGADLRISGPLPRVEGQCRRLAVVAQMQAGPVLLFVDGEGDGVTVHDEALTTGLRGCPTRAVGLDACPVTVCDDAGRAVRALRHHALTSAAIAVGVSDAASSAATAYAAQRRQFGASIDSFPAVAGLLRDIRTRVSGGRAALWAAAKTDGVAPAVDAALIAVSGAVDACLDAIQVHGGYGYMSEYVVERLLRDAISIRARAGGTDALLKLSSR